MQLPALESGQILVKTTEGVMAITLNRPDKLNALTGAMYRDLVTLLALAEEHDDVGAVLIEGQGKSFCAGNDLGDFLAAGNAGDNATEGGAAPFIRAVSRFEKPLVIAVQGNAVGVGVTMLLHADIVVAADDAKFITPFVDLGAVPEAGSAKLLPAWLGYQRAARMLLAGEPLGADEALQCGLVAKVVARAELEGAARGYAVALAAKPRRAMRESKRLMRQAPEMALHDLIDHDLALFAELLRGDEAKEILAAKLGKK
ncbi:enoyl-CoA hydratase-related protein [Alloalcanivorax gelatiniphagus]|nr:enoyl-CoA hydratase-related protein [Alloalcanivorax gelatiniphagus]